MSGEFILLLHPAFGILALLAAVWVFVESLNTGDIHYGRIRNMSLVVAVLMWLTYLIGGYWYVVFYGGDKAVIKAGPWPFAHSFFMETKEHVFFMLLLLATFLPIITGSDLIKQVAGRKVVQWTAAMIIVLALLMEGAGAVISMGVKVGLFTAA
ncbi:hypothetical protein [Vibrio mangrovi]|uniref:Uncharacterized protein n=1 Tax=Vibrio mangrovi TaxID=474394 RepID=A0A1Y6IXT2_9VIBR|nr:hypothetical protein [Vibrio mangrovi]MDW6005053.1 hypothetical protein [Vibrio mangrovi]SMS01821.1 hypothetical protein VIM7927_03129 [Vibrio mangrovi]